MKPFVFVSVSEKQLYYKLRTRCQRHTSFYKNCWFIVRKSGIQKWWSGKGGLLCISWKCYFVCGIYIPCLPLCGQCPAVYGTAVLAVFLLYHRPACAPAGSGPLQGVPATVLGLWNSAQLGFCSGNSISVFIVHVCARELVSLLLLFGFRRDSSELSLNIEVWECSLNELALHGSLEAWTWWQADTSQWPSFWAVCFVRGCPCSLKTLASH